MRKFLLTTVGVTALAVSANATDFTLSGSATLTIDDDGNTSMAQDIEISASRTFDNGMTASFTIGTNDAGVSSTEMSLTADAVEIVFSDFDDNAKTPGLNAGDGGADIATEGVTTDDDDVGAISAAFSLGTLNLAVATNDNDDLMIGASTSFDVGGISLTVGADMYEETGNSADNMTSIGVSTTIGSLSLVAVQDQHDAASTATDETSYSLEYALGDVIIGAQGADDESSISAAYTITPGMTFEMGNEDNGTTDTATATLELSF